METANSQRYVLTGATGALGFHFAAHVLKTDVDRPLTFLCRVNSSSYHRKEFQDLLAEYGHRIEIINTDLTADRLAPDAVRAIQLAEGGLWHFAARTVLRTNFEESDELTRAANFEGTLRLLHAATSAPQRHPFYHISTAYVAGTREGTVYEHELDEGQDFRNAYESSKFKAECAVAKVLKSGHPGLILRPSVVLEDSQATGAPKMTDLMASAVLLSIKRNETLVMRYHPEVALNLVHMDWVLETIEALAANPKANGGTFHLTARQSACVDDVLQTAATLVPGFRYRFQPDIDPIEMSSASRVLDRAFADIRPYFYACIDFDRTQTNRFIPARLAEQDFDAASAVRRRVISVLERQMNANRA